MNSQETHYEVKNMSDRVALRITKFLRFIADTFLKKNMVIELSC